MSWHCLCLKVPVSFVLPWNHPFSSFSSQLYVSYKNGKVDQALSLGFLLCWLGGDFTNLVGCYLTKQLPIQVNIYTIKHVILAVKCWLFKTLVSYVNSNQSVLKKCRPGHIHSMLSFAGMPGGSCIHFYFIFSLLCFFNAGLMDI